MNIAELKIGDILICRNPFVYCESYTIEEKLRYEVMNISRSNGIMLDDIKRRDGLDLSYQLTLDVEHLDIFETKIDRVKRIIKEHIG